MAVYRSHTFWIAGLCALLLFSGLLAARLGLLPKGGQPPMPQGERSLPDRDTWMNIIQNGRKIGFSHSVLEKQPDGYRLQETLFMRINTMGMVHGIRLRTTGALHSDLTLAAFDFDISSGRFSFSMRGTVSDRLLTLTTGSAGHPRTTTVRLRDKPYLAAGLLDTVRWAALEPGETRTVQVFDPATMGQEPVNIRVEDQESISIMGRMHSARRVALEFKGVTQQAWIDADGRVLKEKGFLGISLERTSRREALGGLPIEASQDLTRVASVAANGTLDDIAALNRLVVEIDGIDTAAVHLDQGRQKLQIKRLTIRRENLEDLAGRDIRLQLTPHERRFLAPTPFIQADHPAIRKTAADITAGGGGTLETARKLVEWVNVHVEKRPVISLPDALSTLENRVGDCNEHAVLLAALARAAGIPAQVEAGLVYLKGRFYYHAWNLLFLNRWVTADALLGQLPADVTHIRLSGGKPQDQLDLMNVIGRIRLKIIEPPPGG